MKQLNFPSEVFVVLPGLIPFVGISQALLAAGQKPRMVSALAGMSCYAVALSSSFLRGELQTYIGPLIYCTIYCTIYGTIAGYICGMLIGGVFLVSDHLRRVRLSLRKPRYATNEDDADSASPWEHERTLASCRNVRPE